MVNPNVTLHAPKPANASTLVPELTEATRSTPIIPHEINFADVGNRSLDSVLEICEEMLGLEGELQGTEFIALNPKRADTGLGSFKINVSTGAWADFAESDAKGGDLISLVAYLNDCSQTDAAKTLESFLSAETVSEHSSAEVQISSTRTKKRHWQTEPGIEHIPYIQAMADEEVAWEPKEIAARSGKGKLVATYEYNNADNALHFMICRFVLDDGAKTFAPLSLWKDAEGSLSWQWVMPQGLRPLYNLSKLADAPISATVVIVEGEKAANALQVHLPDHVVVTSAGGARAPSKTDWSPLAGRKVIVWPDNDVAGKDYAEAVTVLLAGIQSAPSVRGLDLDTLYRNLALLQDWNFEAKLPELNGWDAADVLDLEIAPGWIAQELKAGLQAPTAVTPSVDTPDGGGCPNDFKVDGSGVKFLKVGAKGETKEIWLSSPIRITALARDRSGNDWASVLEFPDSDNRMHQWAMPRELLGGDPSAFCRTLLSMGALVTTENGNRSLLAQYLMSSNPTDRAISASHPGWYNDVFILTDGIGSVFGRTDDRVVLPTNDPSKSTIFEPSGTLEEWQEHVGHLCAGNSRVTVGICSALAGPVLKLMGEENGGFHFRGDSSSGKTTLLIAAASVWGHERKVMRNWNATQNGLEAVATAMNDTVFILDEIGQASRHELGATIYALANGQGKSRANQTGAARAISSWRMMLLSSGEVRMADVLSLGGEQSMAGHETRLVDIGADAGAGHGVFDVLHGAANGAALSLLLKANARKYFGVAGRAFVRALADPERQNDLLAEIRETLAAFETANIPEGADGQVQRVAHRFGLIAAVGELGIRLEILPWPVGSATDASRRCLDLWIRERGGSGAHENTQILEQIRRYLEQFGNSRFVELENTSYHPTSDPDRVFSRTGFRQLRADDTGTDYFVLPEMFKSELCAGHDSRRVAKLLKSLGFLGTDRHEKAPYNKHLPVLGTRKVYHIKAEILWAEEQGGPEIT
jgi:putative DNA primase/helicase